MTKFWELEQKAAQMGIRMTQADNGGYFLMYSKSNPHDYDYASSLKEAESYLVAKKRGKR